MLIATGTALVLLTWLLVVACLISLGLLPALAISRNEHARERSSVIRRSLWWGIALVSITVTLINLAVPLGSRAAASIMLGLVLVLGIPGWILLTRTCRRSTPRDSRLAYALLWFALILSICFVAVAALGPVTNYDSGLYHLGAIRYATDFSTIPGLANLYFPLGYASVEFPLAAFLGNGPWQHEGFRLLNGLIMMMAAADLLWRSRRRILSPGFCVAGMGILCAWTPFVVMSGFWITSPAQDASVFVLTMVATGYLAQAVAGGSQWLAEGATAAVIGVVLVMIRPTMIVWSALVVVVLVVLLVRRRALSGSTTPALVSLVPIAVVALLRFQRPWQLEPVTAY